MKETVNYLSVKNLLNFRTKHDRNDLVGEWRVDSLLLILIDEWAEAGRSLQNILLEISCSLREPERRCDAWMEPPKQDNQLLANRLFTDRVLPATFEQEQLSVWLQGQYWLVE